MRAALEYLAQDPRARALVDELNASATLDAHSEARLFARISRETQSMRAAAARAVALARGCGRRRGHRSSAPRGGRSARERATAIGGRRRATTGGSPRGVHACADAAGNVS